MNFFLRIDESLIRIIKCYLQATIWMKTLSSSIWNWLFKEDIIQLLVTPWERFFPASSAIDPLGKDIILLLLTPWGRLLASSIYNWLSGRRYYSASSGIDSLKKHIIQFLLTLWGRILSSSIYNWLSWRKHYLAPSDSLGEDIIQLHLELTL